MQYDFPNKEAFPSSAPRYPNIWIFVSEQIASNYREALKFTTERLEECTEMFNDYGYFHTAEGCDAVARRRGLQYIELGKNGELSHDHSLHIRFYTQTLKRMGKVEIDGINYYIICASVHYEVDRPSHLHPFVDECPICGCVGDDEKYYEEEYHNRSSQLKNEMLHDPLGVEAMLYGTVRGKKIPLFSGLDIFEEDYSIKIEVIDSPREDINTKNLGLLFFQSKK